MRKIWVRKAKSFLGAETQDLDYYASMSPEERLETMQFLRDTFLKLRKQKKRAQNGKGLRRSIKIIQQT